MTGQTPNVRGVEFTNFGVKEEEIRAAKIRARLKEVRKQVELWTIRLKPGHRHDRKVHTSHPGEVVTY